MRAEVRCCVGVQGYGREKGESDCRCALCETVSVERISVKHSVIREMAIRSTMNKCTGAHACLGEGGEVCTKFYFVRSDPKKKKSCLPENVFAQHPTVEVP